MALKETLVDTVGLGFALWLLGYLAGMVLFFVLPQNVMGWMLFVIFTPVTIYVAYWRFHKRQLSLPYYLGVAVVWAAIAIVFDYLFIVLMLNSTSYYKLDVFAYYAAIILIPVGIGLKYKKV